MKVVWETYKFGSIILYFESLQGSCVFEVIDYSFFLNDFQHPTPVPLSTTFFFIQNAWHVEQASDVHLSAYQDENLEWGLVSNKVIFLFTWLKKKMSQPTISSLYSFWAYHSTPSQNSITAGGNEEPDFHFIHLEAGYLLPPPGGYCSHKSPHWWMYIS